MTAQSIGTMLGLGLVAGVIGGMFGIGGGLVIVPALALLFGYDRDTATGTSLLAQLLPVGLLGVREYWQRGQVSVASGLWIAVGLLFGGLLGARLAGIIPPATMKKGYGIFLVVVGIYFLLAPPAKTPAPETPPAAAGTEAA